MKRMLGCISGLMLLLSVSQAEALFGEMRDCEGMADLFSSTPASRVDVDVQQKDDMWVYDYIVHNLADDVDSSILSFTLLNIWEQKAWSWSWTDPKTGEIVESFMSPMYDFDPLVALGTVSSPEGWEYFSMDMTSSDTGLASIGIAWLNGGDSPLLSGNILTGFRIETPFSPGKVEWATDNDWGIITGPVPETREFSPYTSMEEYFASPGESDEGMGDIFDALPASSSDGKESIAMCEQLSENIPAGTVPGSPLLPSESNDPNNSTDPFVFPEVSVQPNQWWWFDPDVAIGYDYQVTGPNFAGVTLPTGIGDDNYTLHLYDQTS